MLIASQLIELEDSILAENYTEGNGNARDAFLNAMRSPRVDYDTISNFTNHLMRSLASPPYIVILKRVIGRKFRNHNLHNYGGGILWCILGYLYGDEHTIEINRSIFEDYMSSTADSSLQQYSLCKRKADRFKFVGEI